MNKYNKGKIYMITSIHTEDIYIGSTTKPLCDRLSGHKCDFRRHMDGKFPYLTSFDILKHGDYSISLIEICNVDTREELFDREAHYILNLPNVINHHVPNRTYKEWKAENKEKLLVYYKEYNLLNKEKISDYHKNYNIINKDKIKEKNEQNKEHIAKRPKIYHNKNQDHIKETHKEWKLNNKEKIKNYKKERSNIKIDCPCSARFAIDHKANHERSKKHQKYLNSLPQ